jgi:hypothetical protein
MCGSARSLRGPGGAKHDRPSAGSQARQHPHRQRRHHEKLQEHGCGCHKGGHCPHCGAENGHSCCQLRHHSHTRFRPQRWNYATARPEAKPRVACCAICRLSRPADASIGAPSMTGMPRRDITRTSVAPIKPSGSAGVAGDRVNGTPVTSFLRPCGQTSPRCGCIRARRIR